MLTTARHGSNVTKKCASSGAMNTGRLRNNSITPVAVKSHVQTQHSCTAGNTGKIAASASLLDEIRPQCRNASQVSVSEAQACLLAWVPGRDCTPVGLNPTMAGAPACSRRFSSRSGCSSRPMNVTWMRAVALSCPHPQHLINPGEPPPLDLPADEAPSTGQCPAGPEGGDKARCVACAGGGRLVVSAVAYHSWMYSRERLCRTLGPLLW